MKPSRRYTAVPEFFLSVQYAEETAAALFPRNRIRTVIRRALDGRSKAVITVRFVGEEEGREINRSYRGKDYATNVLTFNSEPGESFADMPAEHVIDIVICTPVLLVEAAEQEKTAFNHLAHLLVHAVLHGFGYDHETKKEASEMEAEEIAVLATLGISDPYVILEDPGGAKA